MGAMLNGQPRRTVRSRRSSSIIAQAVAILARYGGSLWVSDPAYTFTGSDGTGAAGDGSDTGYVRDLCGNARPLTQATTGFKPKLKRVPKRLGPELVANGDFSGGLTGWLFNSGSAAIVSGEAEVTSGAAGYGTLYQVATTKAGAPYLVTGKVRCGTVGSAVLRARNAGFTATLGSVTVTSTTAQDVSFTFTAESNQSPIQLINNSTTAALTSYADNISVREVIEWGWAWVFDGVDDLIATVPQPVAASETLIVAKRMSSLPASTRTAMSKAGTNTGVELYANSSVYNNSQIGTGSGYVYKSAFGSVGTAVHGAVVTPTSRQIRVNGGSAGVEAITFSSAAATIKIGGGTVPFNAEIFAAAYIPGAPADAELLIVERAMAQLAGVTI